MKREIVVLTGRVQGVGFRDRVVRIARRFPVAGTVSNLPDGRRLQIDVEGPLEAVDTFIDAVLADPPALGRVDRIERTASTPQGVTGFAQRTMF